MEEEIIEPVEKKKTNKGLIVVLLSLLLLGSGIGNFVLWNKSHTANSLAAKSIDSLKSVNTLKDSLYTMLADEEASIASLRTEISLYQNENDSLKQILEAKEKKIAALRAQIGGGSPGKLRALKDSLNVIALENKAFKEKVEVLLLENEDYRAQLALKEEKINALNSTNQQLNDKVTIAAEPNVGPVTVTPMASKKGVFSPNFKAKKVEKLVVSFDLLGNKLTDRKVEKTYTVRIKDPDKIVLSNDNGSLMNSDDVFTIKKEVSFDGTQQKIKVDFVQKPKYKKGRYTVELKDGDEVKYTSSFELN